MGIAFGLSLSKISRYYVVQARFVKSNPRLKDSCGCTTKMML